MDHTNCLQVAIKSIQFNVKPCLKEKKKTKIDTRDKSDKSSAKQRKRACCEAEQDSQSAKHLSNEQMSKRKSYTVPTKQGQRLDHVTKLPASLSPKCRCYCHRDRGESALFAFSTRKNLKFFQVT
jgi:hypothetical protein